ncbi:aminotransferase class V-fold PLP-dependent enzyme [Nocardioides lianchengensis]|uniref:Selenocysteine lyase/Cysteine desulfurase n=1 Tax=Nocardioides lianchengensis TaxID=1045774 RepID=A0A1G7BWU5_9ACTN|nr:aminotransferase class V-fold PLP-dependent enzyme [Nocardioides lianchengensis]NYG09305.1 selenocysteine lyase/cysteine desulfurase [Nocardioides lianchengensis]SDE31527.1 Selenocysteine lyase/Cysteine desulfurase [Nocardioides lianchengensis]
MPDPTFRAPLLPLVGADTLVPVLDGRRMRQANFDAAASAPALREVADRVTEALPWYASVHRGAGYLSQVSTALYESARERIGAYVEARPDDIVVITRNTTDATNLLATVTPGPTLALDLEHHAALLPWRLGAGSTVLTPAPTVAGTLDLLDAELARTPYALLVVTGASNVTGEALPVDRVVELAHRHGARVLVDGAQLLAHRRLSLAGSGVDYVALSGHKLYAPFGAGALVGRRDWLDEGRPHLAGGGAVTAVGTDSVSWASAPARHEGGTPNLLGAVALATACDVLAGAEHALDEHERALRGRLLAGLRTIHGLEVVRLWPEAGEPVGVVTFTVPEDPTLVASVLAAEHAVALRAGRFCAHPLFERLGLPAGALRVAVGAGTSSDDVDRLVGALRQVLSEGPRGRYREDGDRALLDDPRPLPELAGLTSLDGSTTPCTDVDEPVPV